MRSFGLKFIFNLPGQYYCFNLIRFSVRHTKVNEKLGALKKGELHHPQLARLIFAQSMKLEFLLPQRLLVTIISGWGARIRTRINGFKVRRATIAPRPNVCADKTQAGCIVTQAIVG